MRTKGSKNKVKQVKRKPVHRINAESNKKSLQKITAELIEAQSNSSDIEKGLTEQAKIEQSGEPTGEQTTDEQTTDPITGEKKVETRGRKKKKTGDETETDYITTTLNGVIIPLVATKFDKDVKDCMFTKDQMKEAKRWQPDVDFLQPSWLTYIPLVIAMAIGNFMQAKTTLTEEQVKKTVKGEFDALTKDFRNPTDEQVMDSAKLNFDYKTKGDYTQGL